MSTSTIPRHPRKQYNYQSNDVLSHVEDLPGRDRRWIQRAVGFAMTSDHSCSLGALAVTGGSLIAKETNRKRNTARIVEWGDCSVHAEAALCSRWDIEGSIVYVARVTANGSAALARPCRFCLNALTAAGVKRVVWTVDEETVATMNLG